MRGRGFSVAAVGALRSRLPVAAGLSLALLLPACNNKKSPTAPTATPTPTAKAVVTISLLNLQLQVVQPPPDKNHPGFYNELIYTLHVVESGGVGCYLNYVRLDVYSSDGTFIERSEHGSSYFTGGNRLDAGHTRDFTVISGFNSDLKHIYLVVSVGTTDDNGNNQVSQSGQLVIA